VRNFVVPILLSVSLTTALHAAPKLCNISPAILDVYRHPVTATSAEWAATRNTMNDLMNASCADGPKDEASRAVIFSLLEKEMSLDYTAVFESWQKRSGKPLSEGAFEGVLYFQRDLLTYIDRIVSPRDLEYQNTILEYANGRAISKLGRSVVTRVIEQSGKHPSSLHGLGQKNRQEEAFRAIGYWLDPDDSTLTAAEKTRHSIELTGILPPDGLLRSDLHSRMVATVVEALAHSDERRVEEKIRAWRHTYENANGTGDSIAALAQKAADQIKIKAEARAKNQS
jgi:hypothetical protein